jgi:hypothetical protein
LREITLHKEDKVHSGKRGDAGNPGCEMMCDVHEVQAGMLHRGDKKPGGK